MTLAHVLHPAPSDAVVVPFSRSKEATSSAHWSAALLVLDARIAVAEECAHALGPSRRGRELQRCLPLLASVREGLETLFANIVAAELQSGSQLQAAREYVAAICGWSTDVAGALREMASADECHWSSVRDSATRVSSARVRSCLVALFADLEAECPRPSAMHSVALALQGDVVVMNWSLRG